MALATLTAILISAAIAIGVLGLIIVTVTIAVKVTIRNLKQITRNNDRISHAHRAIVHSKNGNFVKLDLLDKKKEKFAELNVTGTSASRMLREGRKIRV